MTVTPTPGPDADAPEPAPEGQALGGDPLRQPRHERPVRAVRVPGVSTHLAHLSLQDFHAAYRLAVTTSDDPALDGLLLRHLLVEAARPAELLDLRCEDLDLADATITHWRRTAYRAQRRPSTPEHVADLVAHAAERGPRTPAPADAPEELRRAGVPALSADDPVFYNRPADVFDADGFLLARRVRPLTRRRLTFLVTRIREYGGPELTASAVRALSIRLIRSAGGGTEAEHWLGHGGMSTTRHCIRERDGMDQFGRLKRSLFADLPMDPDDDAAGTGR